MEFLVDPHKPKQFLATIKLDPGASKFPSHLEVIHVQFFRFGKLVSYTALLVVNVCLQLYAQVLFKVKGGDGDKYAEKNRNKDRIYPDLRRLLFDKNNFIEVNYQNQKKIFKGSFQGIQATKKQMKSGYK